MIQDRINAIKWWNSLNDEDKEIYHECYKTSSFTPSIDHTQLTGREIEKIQSLEPKFKKIFSKKFKSKL